MENKLKFDKHCHPGNMTKKLKNVAEYEVAAEFSYCSVTDPASHWRVQCIAIPRSAEIRMKAIQFIRDLVTSTIAEHTENSSKLALSHLGNDYLSFLTLGTGNPPKSGEDYGHQNS